MQEVGQVNSWLQSQHVLVSQEWLEACLDWIHQENQGANLPRAQLNQMVYEQWLQADLQVVAPGCLPQGIAQEQKTVLNGKFALQINSMIDVSVPAYTQLQKLRGRENANDAVTAETQATQKPWEQKPTRMLMLQLTDGQQNLQGMEYQPIRDLAVDMAPGTKILVSGPVQCRLGVLLLDGRNVKVLGGEVEELAEENRMENVLLKAVSEQGAADPTLVQQQQQIQQEYRQSTANNTRNTASTRQQNNQGRQQNNQGRQQNNQGRQPGWQGNADFGQGNSTETKANKKTTQPPVTFTDDFEDDDFLDNMDLGELDMLENQEMQETKPPKTLQNPPVVQQRQNMNKQQNNARSLQQNNAISFPKAVKTEQTDPFERGVMQRSSDNFSTRNPPAAQSGHNHQGGRDEFKYEPEWDEPFDIEGVEESEERKERLDTSSRQVKQENSTSSTLNRSAVFQIDDEPDWDDPLLMEGMAGNMSAIDNDVWDDPFDEEGDQHMVQQGTSKDAGKVEERRDFTVPKRGPFENKASFEDRSKPVQSVEISLPTVKPSLRPPTVQQKSESQDIKVKREPNINQASNLHGMSDAAVPFPGARGGLSTQKLVQTVTPFSREQPSEMKKRRLDTGVDLDTPPFTYLSKVLSTLPVSNRTVVTVKAFILTLTSKLEKTSEWKMSAMINDGSTCVEVDLGDEVLAKLIGFTVPELKNLVVRSKTDPAIKKRIKEGLEGCQRKLIDLSCLMEVEVSPTLVKPKVIALSDINPTVVRQLQERVDRNAIQ
ncbi:PREDICTED: recQ-mediated genome instability protein 1-like [Branchiostoma belcheri]|uniref:RecQ-mediated genome instability protein 1 n=1 Tax=Branchiostoma belcheri TaxID=7741 RepID=A0A6P4ZQM1_BRABE|nr:PREDICTED: recQ-mediated genome instability protein 1-like [Branchiostoma belcheri]